MVFVRNKLLRGILFTVTFSLSIGGALAANLIGSMTGDFSVSPAGAVSYSVPIKVPEGRGGMKPELGLMYNSQGGGGMLGTGWSISGLSTISRCTTVWASKGKLVPDDTFCLDGETLKQDPANPSLFYKENGDYTQVKAIYYKLPNGDDDISNPNYFEVSDKSGVIKRYAEGDVGAKVQGVGKVVAWGLTKIIDNINPVNNISIQYGQTQTILDANGVAGPVLTNILYPKTIAWMATDSSLYRVNFNYEERQDKSRSVQSTAIAYSTSRLTYVALSWNGAGTTQTIKQYTVGYAAQATGQNVLPQPSFVSQITECGRALGSTAMDCLAPTLFTPTTVAQVPNTPENFTPVGNPGTRWVSDFTGDGKADFLAVDASKANLHTTDGARAFSQPLSFALSFTSPMGLLGDQDRTFIADFNVDGKSDLLSIRKDASGNYQPNLFNNMGTDLSHATLSWATESAAAIADVPSSKAWLGDVNGDGLIDIVDKGTGTTLFVYYNDIPTNHRLSKGSYTITGLQWGLEEQTWQGDYNGDTLMDIATVITGQVVLYLATGERNRPFAKATWVTDNSTGRWAAKGYNWAVDFDNDGLTDVVSAFSTDILVRYNKGNKFIETSLPSPGTLGADGAQLFDVNADGFIDIVSYQRWDNYGVYGIDNTQTFESVNSHSIINYGGVKLIAGSMGSIFNAQNKNYREDWPDWIRAYRNLYSGNFIRDDRVDSILVDDGSTGEWQYDLFTDDNGSWYLPSYLLSSTSNPDYLTQKQPGIFNPSVKTITNALGQVIDIDYAEPGDPSVYQAGTADCVFPVICLPNAGKVVKSHYIDDGIGGKTAYRHFYEDARVNVQGRGSLGFARVTTLDESTGTVTTTEFDNRSVLQYNNSGYTAYAYPFANQPYRSTVSLYDPATGWPRSDIINRDVIPNTVKQMTYLNCTVPPTPDRADVCAATGITAKTGSFHTFVKLSTSKDYEIDPTIAYAAQLTEYASTVEDSFHDSYGNMIVSNITKRSGNAELFTQVVNRYAPDSASGQVLEDYLRYGRLTQTTVVKSYNDACPSVSTEQTDICNIQARTTYYSYNANLLLESSIEAPESEKEELITRYSYGALGYRSSVSISNTGTSYPIPAVTAFTYHYFNHPELSAEVSVDPLGMASATVTNSKIGQVVCSVAQVTAAELGVTGGALAAPDIASFCQGTLGLVSRYEYDAVGRKIKEIQADGSVASTQTLPCDSACSGLRRTFYKTVSEVKTKLGNAIGSVSTTYFDFLGRAVRSEAVEPLSGKVVWQDTEFDVKGRVDRSSRPYFSLGGTPVWTKYYYDAKDRPSTVLAPDGTRSVSRYNGNTTSVTRERRGANETTLLTSRITHNVLGLVAESVDASGAVIRNYYNAFGALGMVQKASSAYLGDAIYLKYDVRGRKIRMNDPDMGIWAYDYDALGNLRAQIDANAQRVVMEYDIVNRMTKRLPQGAAANTAESWIFNGISAPVGSRGKLFKLERSADGYSETYSYDGFGRLTATSKVLDGVTYVSSNTFDTEYPRINTVIYPNISLGTKTAGLTIFHQYNLRGALEAIYENNPSGSLFWQATAADAEGKLLSDKVGNGVISSRVYDPFTGFMTKLQSLNVVDQEYGFDSVGNLEKRIDHLLTVPGTTGPSTEMFAYDMVNRLSSVTQNGILMEAYDYDAYGNIIFNSRVGSYQYGARDHNAGPHAVSNVIGSFDHGKTVIVPGDANGDGYINALDNRIVVERLLQANNDNLAGKPDCNENGQITIHDTVCIAKKSSSTGQAKGYYYDKVGNLTSIRDAVGSVIRAVEYSYLNKPTRIEDVSKNEATLFVYGPTQQRYKQTVELNHALVATVYYLDAAEVIQDSNGRAVKFYIGAGGRQIAVRTYREANAVLSVEERYLHSDYLGSIIAVTNATGQVVERSAYRTFGEKYNPFANEAAPSLYTVNSAFTRRGFTGHETLSGGLIHMNGRVYDAVLGRFLSADPNIQFANDPQSYNRYSYVLNNPLSYTDPSGYFLRKVFSEASRFMRKHERTIIAIAITAIAPNPFMGGFLSSYISSGGNLRAALIGGITAVAFSGLHSWQPNSLYSMDGAAKVFAHGMVGGASAAAQGGDFKEGFMAAAVTQAVSQVVGTKVFGANVEDIGVRIKNAAAAAVVGGTTSVLTGGKFANGAITGAFSRMFNDLVISRDKVTLEEKLSKFVKGKVDSDGNWAFTLDGGVADLTINSDGEIGGSLGFLNGSGTLVEGLQSIGVSKYGASLTISEIDVKTGAFDYSVKYTKSILGFEFSTGFSGNVSVVNQIQNGPWGQNYRNLNWKTERAIESM